MVGKESSVLRHYRVLKEHPESFHLAVQTVYLERAATLESLALTCGGGLVRHDVEGTLDGEGIDCTLNGLYLARGRQHVDTHMRVEHRKPHCASHELYKGILDDQARAVFNGRIYVHKGAQKTDAKQTNRNLLLSAKALVQSNPQLEIFADDVRCTHGSTTGELDADALFYLRTRGLDRAAARGLLTYAFASELVETIDVPALRDDLEEILVRTLPGGEVVREVR
jgi:Fe-S cluster assembly protein SufD